MAIGGSGSQSDYNLVTKEYPGIFGASPESAAIANTLKSLIGTGQPNQTAVSSPYTGLLYQQLARPAFSPTGDVTNKFLNDISDRIKGPAVLRGIDPNIAPSELSTALAPAITALNNQRISNLHGALGTDLSSQLAQRNQNIGQMGQNIEALLNLGGLSMPQIIGGQRGESKGTNIQLMASGSGNGSGGGANYGSYGGYGG